MHFPYFQLLTVRRFLPLFITQFLGALNDNILKNALVILITYKLAVATPGSAQLLVVSVAAIFILPFFLFSALAGQLADKYDKTLLIRAVKLVEVLIILLASCGFHWMNIAVLMMTIFLMGMHSTFFGPLKYAVLPEHLPEDELISGNSLIEAGTFIAILAGTLLGGLLILLEPYGTEIIAIIGMLTALGGLISSFFIPRSKAFLPEMIIEKNIFKETWNILRYTAHDASILKSILGISWFWLVGLTFIAQFPGYTKDSLHGSEHIVTLFLAVFSIGIGIGSLLCNKLLNGQISIKYIPAAALGITLFGIDLYSASSHGSMGTGALETVSQFLTQAKNWRILGDLTGIAIAGGIYIVPLYAFLQVQSDPAYRARIIAANNILNALFMVASSVLAFVLLLLGCTIPQIFLTIALLNGVVAIYSVMAFPESLLKSLLAAMLKALYRIEVKGVEHYHEAGQRVLIIANHTSFLDAMLLAVFLPDKCIFAINSYIARRWWMKPFLGIVKALPVDPLNPMSTKTLIDEVKKNQRVVIFPEGRITVTGSLMKIYEGPGMIADKTEAALLPIRIDGAQYSRFSRMKHVRKIWFPKITLTILPPRQFAIPAALKGRIRRQYCSRKLYDIMSDMMFETSNYQKTLFQSLIEASAIYGAHASVIEDIERTPMHYQALLTRSFILGKILAKTTMPGEFVGVLLPSMSNTIVTFFALQAYGRVPALLNFSAGSINLLSACKATAIKTVITSRRFIEKAALEPVINELSHLVTVCYLEDIRNQVTFIAKIKGSIAGYFPQFAYCRSATGANYRDPAVILYTSGSEGTPKGVVLSHENIQANRYQVAARIDFNAQDTVLNVLPLFHSFGLTAGTLLPLLSGIKTFFYPSPLHYRIIPELAYDINATILFGTDTFLAGYAIHAHPYDFYSVRYVFAGAEKLKERTRSMWIDKFGIRIFEGYGATETSPVLAVNTPMHHKIGSVGRMLPGIAWQLEPVPGIDEGGRLYVKGHNVLQGYLREIAPGVIAALPETSFGQGWYDTGDIVTIDEVGFVTILGRAKRFAKIGGEMISLTALEELISFHWPTSLHAVINIADDKKGEQLILYTTDSAIDRKILQEYAKTTGISPLAIPSKIQHLETMPLLGSGKINYSILINNGNNV